MADDFISRGMATRALAAATSLDKRLATVSFYDLYGALTPESDQTQNIQDGLMAAQRAYYNLRAEVTALDDQMLTSPGVRFVIPQRYRVSSPIIVPEHVTLDCPMGLALASASNLTSAPATTYAGVPNRALSNNFYPMLIVTQGGSTADIQIYPHNGTQLTSGYAYGKTWVPMATACVLAGAGYTAGDVLTLPMPSKGPYLAAQVIVDTVDGTGAILTCHLSTTQPGIYPLPSAAQARYWTVANGYPAGTIAAGTRNQVFDASNNYICGGGTGTGATFSLTWKPDFNGTGGDFDMGTAVQGNARIGAVTYSGAGKANDATYGRQFGFLSSGLQLQTGKITGSGGYIGIWLRSTDFHPTSLLPIGAVILLRGYYGSSIECPDVVLDTWDQSALELDSVSNVHLRGTAFHNTSAAVSTTSPFKLGSTTTSTANCNVNVTLDFVIMGANTNATTAPAVSVAYTRGSKVDVRVNNASARDGTIASVPLSAWAAFGTAVDASCIFRGSIDTGHSQTIQGAIPACDLSIWDQERKTTETGQTYLPVNLVQSPRALATGAWNLVGSAAVTDNAASGPDARDGGTTTTASMVNLTTSSDQVRSPAITYSATDKQVASCWFKYGTASLIYLQLGDSTGTNGFTIAFNPNSSLVNSTSVAGAGQIIRYGVTPYNNGWNRLWCYGISGAASVRLSIRTVNSYGTTYVYGPMVENNPTRLPGSYVDPLPLTVNVSQTATTIAYPSNSGGLYVVSGNTSGTNRFSDLVFANAANATAISSQTVSGAPGARTYSIASGALQLVNANSTYSVSARPMG